jgi:hypothetical protein
VPGALQAAKKPIRGREEIAPGLKPIHCRGFSAEAQASASHRRANTRVFRSL